jgi:hypothetical protein
MTEINLVGMPMISHFTKFACLSATVHMFVSIKQNVNFECQPPAMFVFLVSRKSGLIKRCSSSEDLSVYNISLSHVDRWKFCIPSSLNVRHVRMVEATGLKIMAWRPLPVAWSPYWIS